MTQIGEDTINGYKWANINDKLSNEGRSWSTIVRIYMFSLYPAGMVRNCKSKLAIQLNNSTFLKRKMHFWQQKCIQYLRKARWKDRVMMSLPFSLTYVYIMLPGRIVGCISFPGTTSPYWVLYYLCAYIMRQRQRRATQKYMIFDKSWRHKFATLYFREP